MYEYVYGIYVYVMYTVQYCIVYMHAPLPHTFHFSIVC